MANIWHFMIVLMAKLLITLFEFTGNYGVAIIVFTIIIKIVLHPLTVKQFKSMKEMQKIQPLMKKIQEKYKANPQEMQKRIFGLYKEHKVNPFGGCLPLLIQMPILLMLYQTINHLQQNLLSNAFLWRSQVMTEKISFFTQTGFLWIPTLFAPDFLLLVLYTISMYITQKLTVMPTMDESQKQQQQMMSIMMPMMFFFMFSSYPMPSAFILYWLIFNILSTAAQIHIMKEVKEEIQQEISDKGSKPKPKEEGISE